MEISIDSVNLSWVVDGITVTMELSEHWLSNLDKCVEFCKAKEIDRFGEIKTQNLKELVLEAIKQYDLQFDGG